MTILLQNSQENGPVLTVISSFGCTFRMCFLNPLFPLKVFVQNSQENGPVLTVISSFGCIFRMCFLNPLIPLKDLVQKLQLIIEWKGERKEVTIVSSSPCSLFTSTAPSQDGEMVVSALTSWWFSFMCAIRFFLLMEMPQTLLKG